jgi:hypothetical protein
MAIRVCVLIPCHLRYDEQISFLTTCIASLKAQTHPCDIFLSVSGNDVDKIDIDPATAVTIKSSEQKYQMEHLHTFRHAVKSYDLILFCDDDDFYHPLRVAAFVQAYQARFPVLGDHTIIVEQNGEEYWEFGITPFWFETFWERVQDVSLLRCKYGDMYLRNFFRSPRCVQLCLPSPLYFYRQHPASTLATMPASPDALVTSPDALVENIRLSLSDCDKLPGDAVYENGIVCLAHALGTRIVSVADVRAWLDLRNRLLQTTTSEFLDGFLQKAHAHGM